MDSTNFNIINEIQRIQLSLGYLNSKLGTNSSGAADATLEDSGGISIKP